MTDVTSNSTEKCGNGRVRFACPNDPSHSDFYLRRSYSEAYRVSQSGRVADHEMRNSMEGEGRGPVCCDQCKGIVECEDATPSADLLNELCPHGKSETRACAHQDPDDCLSCACCGSCREDVDPAGNCMRCSDDDNNA
jgi:hypothetical protein